MSKKKNGTAQEAMSDWITPKKAAALLGVSTQLIYKMIYRGRFQTLKVEGTWRVFRKSVEKYIGENIVLQVVGPDGKDVEVGTRCKASGPKQPGEVYYDPPLNKTP